MRLEGPFYVGSAFAINFSFVNSFGRYYTPAIVTYTYLAKNEDDDSWQVIDELQSIVVEPKSSVIIQVGKEHNKVVEGTTLQRKLLVTWKALIDDILDEFTEQVDFELVPQPYIVNPINPKVVKGTFEIEQRTDAVLVKFNHPVLQFTFLLSDEPQESSLDVTMTEAVIFTTELEPGTYHYQVKDIIPLESFVNIDPGEGEIIIE